MSRRSSNQSGFGLVELSIIMVAVVVIGFGGFLAYQREHKNTATDIATNSAHISPKHE
jgi:Tfp pilus assembly protein PilV